jgi:hypothetical protein
MELSRRDVLRLLTAAGAGSLAWGCANCGGAEGGSDAGADAGPGAANACAATISVNHGHVLVVTREDVAAGEDRTYSLRGVALHDHTVTLTAADFATLAAGGTVGPLTSSFSGHAHEVTVVCG